MNQIVQTEGACRVLDSHGKVSPHFQGFQKVFFIYQLSTRRVRVNLRPSLQDAEGSEPSTTCKRAQLHSLGSCPSECHELCKFLISSNGSLQVGGLPRILGTRGRQFVMLLMVPWASFWPPEAGRHVQMRKKGQGDGESSDAVERHSRFVTA
jgi:hypothetical protein